MRNPSSLPIVLSLAVFVTGCQSLQRFCSDVKGRLKVENAERREVEQERLWRGDGKEGSGYQYVEAPVSEPVTTPVVASTAPTAVPASTAAPAPMVEGAPISAPAQTDAPAAEARPRIYVVREGDILGRIARKFDTTVEAICQANGLSDPGKIDMDQQLVIPAPTPAEKKAAAKPKNVAPPPKQESLPARAGYTTYLVKRGDVLSRVAKAHGTTVAAIVKANELASADRLRVGQALYIPQSAAAASVVAPVAPASSVESAVPAPVVAPAPVVKPAPVVEPAVSAPVLEITPPAPAAGDDFLDAVGGSAA